MNQQHESWNKAHLIQRLNIKRLKVSQQLTMVLLEWLKGWPGVISASISVSLTCFISGLHVYQHLKHYHSPELQKYVIRIIAMVPIYAITSFISLWVKNMRISYYSHSIQEIYEAYVIYSFIMLMMVYLGNPEDLTEKCVSEERHVLSFFGIIQKCFLYHSPNTELVNEKFLRKCMQGVLQFVLLRVFFTVFLLITDLFGFYEQSPLYSRVGYYIQTVVFNLSVTIAVFSLIQFYLATEPYLKGFHPLAKFLLIKAIIFVIFWQGIAISIFFHFYPFQNNGPGSEFSDEQRRLISETLQDYLICLETVVASVANIYGFSYKEFVDDRFNETETLDGLGDVVDYSDLATATKQNFKDEVHAVRMVTRTILHPKNYFKITKKFWMWLCGINGNNCHFSNVPQSLN